MIRHLGFCSHSNATPWQVTHRVVVMWQIPCRGRLLHHGVQGPTHKKQSLKLENATHNFIPELGVTLFLSIWIAFHLLLQKIHYSC